MTPNPKPAALQRLPFLNPNPNPFLNPSPNSNSNPEPNPWLHLLYPQVARP